MMSTTARKPATTPIPVQLSEPEFTAFILPHLSMPKRGPKCKLGYHRVFNFILWVLYTPTVSFGITYAVVCTYGYDDGRIWRTRCAVIAAAPVDRESRCRACRRPPGAAGSAHTALAAASRPVSPADPGGFPRSRTTPRSGTTPCGDANPARCAPGTRPCLPRPCLV